MTLHFDIFLFFFLEQALYNSSQCSITVTSSCPDKVCISHEKRALTIQSLTGGLDSSLSPFQHIISDKDETAYVWLGLFHVFQIEKALSGLGWTA